MIKIERGRLRSRAIGEYGSRGAIVTHLAAGAGTWSVVQIRLEPGGVLGLHPAAHDQLLFVAGGSASVRGDDSEPLPLAKGDAVFWQQGEAHETRAGLEGLVATVIEGDGLADAVGIGAGSREEADLA